MKDPSMISRVSSDKGRKIAFCTVILIAILVVLISLTIRLMAPVAASSEVSEVVRVEVIQGFTTTQIGRTLKEKGLIKSDALFRFLSRLRGYDGKYMAGTYIMNSDMDMSEIMKEMDDGNVYINTIRFTIPEGYELKQIAQLLEQKGIARSEKFLEEVREGSFNFEFLKDVPERENGLEGYLFPDTYEVYIGETVHSVIKRMLGRFEEVGKQIGIFESHLKGMTVDDIVILASIIEKEAANDEERALVSAVFHNRLEKGYKLQSCATVAYLLEKRKARLLNKDLEIESPYNTYRVYGLPEGPIASPGMESLKAALHPADVDYLYFVVQKDGNHSFSDNYRDFLRDKQKSR